MSGQRQCGDCSACCRLIEVRALRKPRGVPCLHLAPGGGCAIHGSHPHGCRTYVCSWLVSHALGDHWRPDICGFIVNLQGGGRLVTLEVDPDRPDAWREPAYHPQIRRWAEGVAQGFGVLVFTGEAVTAVFPEQELELGRRDPDAAYVFGYRQTAQGPVPAVNIRDAGGEVRSVTARVLGATGALHRA